MLFDQLGIQAVAQANKKFPEENYLMDLSLVNIPKCLLSWNPTTFSPQRSL